MRPIKQMIWVLGLGIAFLWLSLVWGRGLTELALADGGVFQVSPGGQDIPSCGTGAEPDCRTIKYVVETRAHTGAQVLVTAGVYTEAFTINKAGLALYGAGPAVTIIEGNGALGPLVTFAPGLTNNTTFSGFTVRGGVAITHGGGLYLLNSSPTISAVQVRGNAALTGGGLYLAGASAPSIHNSIICDNSLVQLDNAGSANVDARGVWWGTNNPQLGQAYTGTVASSPHISVSLAVYPTGSGQLPGSGSLPEGGSGQVVVTMRGGQFVPPAGTALTLVAQNGLFADDVPTITLTLVDGLATTTITPTIAGSLILFEQVVISAYHSCAPAQAVTAIATPVVGSARQLFMPLLFVNYATPSCPTTSAAVFDLISVPPPPIDHPDYLHGDLNLAQRGYNPVSGVPLSLQDISGHTDAYPPQLSALFTDNRLPEFSAAYQVNGWDWGCGSDGCPTGPLSEWPTTLIGMVTTPEEPIFIPARGPEIYNNSGKLYKALVLYAEEKRITFSYLHEDTVAHGYSVHIENVCVDPNLLALYRAQVGPDGFRSSGKLPALTEDQILGTALNSEIQVAIRDRGQFMDPRSRKDWWQGK